MSYEPQRGTVASRVVAYLRASGNPATAAVIGDALDVSPSVIDGSLTHAVRHGLVCKERFNGLMHWRLLPHGTAASVEPDDDEDEKPMQRVVPPSEWAKRPDDDPDLAPGMQKIIRDLDTVKPAPKGETLTEQLPTRPPRIFGCGIFSDGRLVLELTSGDNVVLQRDETRALVTFLDRALHEELTA